MGWRENMGVVDIQKVETGHGKTGENTPFTDITDITDRKLKINFIEEFDLCLHGQGCRNLLPDPAARALCRISGKAVFDLDVCPDGIWKRWTEGAVTEIILLPK